MRDSAGTMLRVSPRAANDPDETTLAELRRLGHARTTAENELRDAVKDALALGASVRTVAAAAGLSPTTVQKWKNT